jgi:hypothetical protein
VTLGYVLLAACAVAVFWAYGAIFYAIGRDTTPQWVLSLPAMIAVVLFLGVLYALEHLA